MNINEILEIPQFNAIEVEKLNNEIIITGELINTDKHCPQCGKEVPKPHQYYTRRVRSLPISGKAVYLKINEKILRCEHCKKSFVEKIDFVNKGQTFTKDYIKYIYELAKKQDATRVAEMEGIDTKTVINFFKMSTK